MNPLHATTSAFLFYKIKNARAYFEKKVGVDDVGIVALDEKTLKVELEHPVHYFLSLCAVPTYAPIHKEIDLRNPQWANDLSENFVTNGPFSLKGWKKGVEIYLERNPSYWDNCCVKIDGIEIAIVPDENTQFLMYQKGNLDLIGYPFNELSLDVVDNTHKKGELQVMDQFGLKWFFLNTRKPPFNNRNFRKAVSYAIDRQIIVDHVFGLGEKPAMAILNSYIIVSDKPYFEDGNIELAKKLLDRALLEMGMTIEDLPTFTISQSTNLSSLTLNQVIQQQLSSLGLHVKIDQADKPVFFNRVCKGDYDIALLPVVPWIKDPIYMLDLFRYRDSTLNLTCWENPTYQDLLKKSDHETDPEKRRQYLHHAEALLMEEMPVIPICFNKSYFLCNKHLKGMVMALSRDFDFRYAYFE
ncbi:MAG: peptide ABC transporter substrate-binding protein [Simkaniaceae bacterium]|nr:peptide ABC transporter substrate-binding protein [Simkaniaceae bacterium]